MTRFPAKLQKELNKREEQGNLRQLILPEEAIDFASNDYLGLANNKDFQAYLEQQWSAYSEKRLGSTGSRLLTGNSKLAEELESYLARFFKADAALVFTSGYTANTGVLSAVATRSDTVVYDAHCHASIRQGIQLSRARAYSFLHNDMSSLEQKLSKATGEKYVVVESIYSMDGDVSPLEELLAICQRFNAKLIVDEAHATGVFGENGEGLCVQLGVEADVFARIYTFGKAVASHGAAVLGSAELRRFLINFSKPFIYTTAPSDHTLFCIKEALDFIAHNPQLREHLQHNITRYGKLVKSAGPGPIQTVLVPGNKEVKSLARRMREAGFGVFPILHPTVTEGSERIRICLHSFNTPSQIEDLVLGLKRNQNAR